RKVTTIPARSTSRRSSSSLRTSASSRSKGPSNASRSSSSSRTIMRGTVTLLPDAALRDSHRRAGLDLPRLRLWRSWIGADELPPDEEGDCADPDDDRHPEIDPHAEEVARRIDPEYLLERAEGRVPHDVEREEGGPPEREAPVDPEKNAD